MRAAIETYYSAVGTIARDRVRGRAARRRDVQRDAAVAARLQLRTSFAGRAFTVSENVNMLPQSSVGDAARGPRDRIRADRDRPRAGAVERCRCGTSSR